MLRSTIKFSATVVQRGGNDRIICGRGYKRKGSDIYSKKEKSQRKCSERRLKTTQHWFREANPFSLLPRSLSLLHSSLSSLSIP